MPPTVIDVRYPCGAGRIGLRGSAPLSWETTLPARSTRGEIHRFEIDVEPGTLLELKAIRDDRAWAQGRNQYTIGGEDVLLEPHFDRGEGLLEPALRSLESATLGRAVTFRVFLPPSYGECVSRRYPTLYVQDGQSQFTPDPVDGRSWELDHALDELYALDVIEEVVVVAVHTDQGRLDMLSPMPDAAHGGGGGPRYLAFLVDTLKPFVDAHYRTRKDPASTAILGASMGGLFAFYAAWTRSDVFGRAACLSGSFWWGNQGMVRDVQKGYCPVPRPWLYVDSGVALDMFEADANLRDGFHTTVALKNALVSHCYAPGDDLHTLVFVGMKHDTASWAARLVIPLQLMLPRASSRRG